MYDVRRFHLSLFITVALGLLGFMIAAEGSILSALALAALLVNAALVFSGRFIPMSRGLSNSVTLAGLVFCGYRLMTGGEPPIILIGEFLVILQIIKLYEYRANRDYGQLLVLSALLMVAASISTASLTFGVILTAYLLTALHCCLLFHLKVESDRAKAAQTLPPEKISPATLRQDQHDMPRSMRRLTLLVCAACVVSGVLVFLFFPRGAAGGIFGQMQMRPTESLQAFTDHAGFQQVARITQSAQIVANVKVWHNGKPVEGTMPLVLRGVTFDRYGGRAGDWQWYHSGVWPNSARVIHQGDSWMAPRQVSGDAWRQVVDLLPTGTPALFALPGVASFTPTSGDLRLRFDASDQTLSTDDLLVRPFEYEVVSNNAQAMADPYLRPRPYVSRSDIDPKIAAYVRRPEVTGGLAARRNQTGDVDDLDEQIAANMERYLRQNFTYTLDLTDARSLIAGQDPIVAFLYDLRRGHCEYFAGAMTLMCQSLGMRARMVFGFHCDEYNAIGGYYSVRQLHAHAWVEVFTRRGWVAFDPTSGNMADQSTLQVAMQGIKHFFNFLDYKWATAVVAYDGDRRDEVTQAIESKLMKGTYRGAEEVGHFHQRWKQFSQWLDAQSLVISSALLQWLMLLLTVGVAAAVVWYALRRWKIRRRAARIGLDGLPTSRRLRLAEQLGFYEDLMESLRRRSIVRPEHLTPREFGESLTFLPAESYKAVARLTSIFYRVRFGEARIQPAQQRRLAAIVARLDREIAAAQTQAVPQSRAVPGPVS